MRKLKPCPFCGSDNVKAHSIGAFWNVDCEDCDASGPLRLADRDMAEHMWNDAPRAIAKTTSLGKTEVEK